MKPKINQESKHIDKYYKIIDTI